VPNNRKRQLAIIIRIIETRRKRARENKITLGNFINIIFEEEKENMTVDDDCTMDTHVFPSTYEELLRFHATDFNYSEYFKGLKGLNSGEKEEDFRKLSSCIFVKEN
jgi:hypothetical protein